jgi:U6 snRNA-associated Sm-like protein LSm7
MSERGQFRNTRGPRGGGRGRGSGGAHKHADGAQTGGGADKERPKKENILDLNRFMDKQMKVKFNGGREGR